MSDRQRGKVRSSSKDRSRSRSRDRPDRNRDNDRPRHSFGGYLSQRDDFNRGFDRGSDRDNNNRGGFNRNIDYRGRDNRQMNTDRNNDGRSPYRPYQDDRRYDRDDRNYGNDRDYNRSSYGGGSSDRGFVRSSHSFRGDRGGFRGGRSGGYPAGTEIIKTELYSNFFELLSKPNWVLHQYHVDFEPMIESKRLRIGLLKQHDNLFANNKAFDGMTLYSLTKLDQEITEVESVKNFDQQTVKVRIKYITEISPMSKECIRLFNIIFKRCLSKSKFIEFGRERAYYDFENTIDMAKYGLKIAAGYKASMDVYQSRILLGVEVAHKLINTNTVWTIMENIYQEKERRGQINMDDYKRDCINELVGSTIMTSYNKKTYKIDDIAWDQTPADVFEKKNGQRISFINYYYENYKIRIKNNQQPLLVSLPKQKDKNRGESQPILLVPELCAMTGNAIMKRFEKDFIMKKDLDAVTKLKPEVRVSKLKQLIDKVTRQREAKEDLERWEMKFSSDIVKVNATVFPPNKVFFLDSSIEHTDKNWNNACKDGKHLSAISLKQWVLIYCPRDERNAQMFMNEIMSLSRPMGFQIDQPQMYRLPDSSGGSASILFRSAIKDIVRSNKPQMIACLLPNNNKDIYDAIKITCCVDFGIPSQCVTSSILKSANKVKSVVSKIAIQMNCKLGGEIWAVKIPLKNLMVIGMDIYKDSSKRNHSVAAFTASMNGTNENNLNCTKYFSRCQLMAKGQEFNDGLTIFMIDALNKYHERNKTFPDSIVIYRDGVSDGQFDVVKSLELTQIKNSFKLVNQNYEPKLALIIVKKRGNTRFFERKDRDFYINPQIGTVIDNTIVKNEGNEFYLISQAGNAGTVNPTHFHVLENTTNLTPERLQNLTYRFTHLYYNWPGQIRTPAACHYAAKLAHLVGESLHTPHSINLDDKLFYL